MRFGGAILMVFIACGELAPEPPPAPETFAHCFGRVVCDGLKDCCAAEKLAYDQSACIAVIEGAVQTDVARAKFPDRRFHQDIADQCLKNAEAKARTCDLTDFLLRYMGGTATLEWARCFGVYSSDAPFGASCVDDHDCASGRCTSAFRDSIQHCARLIPQAGDPCASSWDCQSFDDNIASTLRCDLTAHICSTNAAVTCTWDGDCVGLSAGRPDAPCCSVQGGSTQGTCETPPPIGQPCACNSTTCASNATCNYDKGYKCIAAAGRGESCASVRCRSMDVCDATEHCSSHLTQFCGGG